MALDDDESELGGAAALVPEAERLKRFHDARNMLRETMKRWDDFMRARVGFGCKDQMILGCANGRQEFHPHFE
jgi:hypothetical protein